MWESKEHFEQSADRIQSVLSGLAELISGPPEVYEGNSGYILIEINYYRLVRPTFVGFFVCVNDHDTKYLKL